MADYRSIYVPVDKPYRDETVTPTELYSPGIHLLDISVPAVLTAVTLMIAAGGGFDVSELSHASTQQTVIAGSAAAPGLAIVGDTDTGLYSPAANQIAAATGGAQRGLFSSAGLAVTGDVSATDGSGTIKLDASTTAVVFSGNAQAYIANEASDAADLRFRAIDSVLFETKESNLAGGTWKIRAGVLGNGDFVWNHDAGGEAMRFDASIGRFGIATAAPLSACHVQGATGYQMTLFVDSNTNGHDAGLQFFGKNVGGGSRRYAGISMEMEDTADASEDGALFFSTTLANVTSEKFRITSSGSINIAAGDAMNFNGPGAWYVRHRTADQPFFLGVENTAGTLYYPIQMNPQSQFLAFSDENGEVARFQGTKFGIGTTNPADLLTVNGSASFGTRTAATYGGRVVLDDCISVIRNTNGWLFRHGRSDSSQLCGLYAHNHSATAMSLRTGDTDRIYIKHTGEVGLGTTSPQEALHTVASNGIIAVDHSTANAGTVGFKLLHIAGGANQHKVAILSDATGSWGKGNLHFCVDTVSDSNNVGIGDAKMSIDGLTGYVGIGTPDPSQLLHAKGTVRIGNADNTAALQIAGAGDVQRGLLWPVADGIGLFDNSFNSRFYATTNAAYIWAGGVDRLHIKSTGEVGLGTTNPTTRLEVADTNCIIKSRGTGGYGAFYAEGSGTNAAYMFFANTTNSERGRIAVDNNRSMYLSTNNGVTNSIQIASNADTIINGNSTRIATFDASTHRLGLGTSSPLTDIHANSGSGARIRAGGAVGSGFEFNDANVRIVIPAANSMEFITGGAGAMYINASRYVGVNTNNPGAPLEVNGIIRMTANANRYMQVGSYSTASDNFGYISSAGQASGTGLKFETTNGSGTAAGSGARMTIFNDGGVVIGTPTGSTKGAGTLNAVAVYDDNSILSDLVLDQAVTGTFDRKKYANHPIAKIMQDWWFDPDKYAAFWRTNRHLPGIPTFSNDNRPSTGESITQLTATVETQAVLIEKLNSRIKTLEQTA